MKKSIKIIIGILILILILYFGIVMYLYYQGEKDKIIQNSCNFTRDYNTTLIVDNLNQNYNNSINNLNKLIKNEKI